MPIFDPYDPPAETPPDHGALRKVAEAGAHRLAKQRAEGPPLGACDEVQWEWPDVVSVCEDAAEYVATFDPCTVLALLDEIATLQASVISLKTGTAYSVLQEEIATLRAERDAAVRDLANAIRPVRDWYDGDGEIAVSDVEIAGSAVADLQADRAEVLELHQKVTTLERERDAARGELAKCQDAARKSIKNTADAIEMVDALRARVAAAERLVAIMRDHHYLGMLAARTGEVVALRSAVEKLLEWEHQPEVRAGARLHARQADVRAVRAALATPPPAVAEAISDLVIEAEAAHRGECPTSRDDGTCMGCRLSDAIAAVKATCPALVAPHRTKED